ncbi:predicted protein, partial [Nematostella vectensis]
VFQWSFSTGGWGAMVADAFQRKCDVLNRGFTGYTSAYNRLILPSLLATDNTPEGSIVAVVILLGSNDSVLYDIDQRGLELEDYTDNLRNIIHQFKQAGVPDKNIILMTPPPICEEMYEKSCLEKGKVLKMNLCSTRTKEFAHACLEVGLSQGVDIEDLHTSMHSSEDWQSLLSDGLHLSAAGNEFVGKQLVRLLHTKLDKLPDILPEWSAIDPNNPENLLGKYNKQ